MSVSGRENMYAGTPSSRRSCAAGGPLQASRRCVRYSHGRTPAALAQSHPTPMVTHTPAQRVSHSVSHSHSRSQTAVTACLVRKLTHRGMAMHQMFGCYTMRTWLRGILRITEVDADTENLSFRAGIG